MKKKSDANETNRVQRWYKFDSNMSDIRYKDDKLFIKI